MTHYAISDLDGKVCGFCPAEELPADGPGLDRIAHAIAQAMPFFPESDSPTKVLYITDGELHWVETGDLAQIRQHKTEVMNTACTAQIMSGFTCDALGAPHHYPSDQQDQANLVASITDSLLAGGDPEWVTPFKCADADGVWQYRPHSIAQIQQVGRAGKASVLTALAKNEELRQQIATATAEQLDNIQWDQP